METGRGVAEECQGVTSAIGNIADFRLEETPGGETWEEVTGSITSTAVSHDVHTYAYATVRIFGGEKKIQCRFVSKFARLSRMKWEISIIPVEAFSASTSFQTGKS